MSAAGDELMDQLYELAKNPENGYPQFVLLPEFADRLVLFIAQHDKALLGRVRTEVIGEDDETDGTFKSANVPKYVRNLLRAEQRKKLNALLPSGGVEGEHHGDSK